MIKRIVGRILRGKKGREDSEEKIAQLLTIPEEILQELEAMGGVNGEAEAIRRRRALPITPVPRY